MNDINDIRPPVYININPFIIKLLIIIVLSAILISVLYFIIKIYIKKRKKNTKLLLLPAPLPPLEAALEEINNIKSFKESAPRLFYYKMTYILKKFIGRFFKTNAPEMTTQEFIKTIKNICSDNIFLEDMIFFLKNSDYIKYAGITTDKNAMDNDHILIVNFIKYTAQSDNIDEHISPLTDNNKNK